MISPDPNKFDFISNSYKLADGCILDFSILYEEYKEKETIIELSNALKIICSILAYSASKIALNYALGSEWYLLKVFFAKCFKINVLMN